MRDLEFLYNDVDAKAVAFAKISQLACPEGCGKCCGDTEVSPVEATLIAAYIGEHRPELASVLATRLKNPGRECVFYDRDSPLHCTVYPVRPLICRCFGYSAEKDKIGNIMFPACQHMDLPDGLRSGGGVVRVLFEPYPPVMSEYRQAINSLETGASRMRPLGQAVFSALNGENTVDCL